MGDATSNAEFRALVETAWHDRTLGDLNIASDDPGNDDKLADVVDRIAHYARANIAETRDVQHDATGAEIPGGRVSNQELARRIAAGLDVILYGGAA